MSLYDTFLVIITDHVQINDTLMTCSQGMWQDIAGRINTRKYGGLVASYRKLKNVTNNVK